MFSILFIYLFVCFWSDGSEVKKSRSSIGNGFLLKFAGLETIVFCSTLVCVCVCVTFLCCQSVFICFIQVQNTPQGKCTPTHTHTPTHTILSTRTYPSSTAATQQMCRAGFNFLAPASCIFHHDHPVPTQPLPLHNAIDWRLSHQTLIKSLIF